MCATAFTFNHRTSALWSTYYFLIEKKRTSDSPFIIISCLPHHFESIVLSCSPKHYFLSSFFSACFTAISPTLPLSIPQGSVLVHFILSFHVLFPSWPQTLMWFSLPLTPPCVRSAGSALQLQSLLGNSTQQVSTSTADTGCLNIRPVISFQICSSFRLCPRSCFHHVCHQPCQNLGVILNFPFTLNSYIHYQSPSL